MTEDECRQYGEEHSFKISDFLTVSDPDSFSGCITNNDKEIAFNTNALPSVPAKNKWDKICVTVSNSTSFEL